MKVTDTFEGSFGSRRRRLPVALVLGALGLALALGAEVAPQAPGRRTGTVMILYTNDVHDFLKPQAPGMGGLAHVSGFIRRVKQERQDVLVLDAGDACTKGDMLGVVTRGEMTYRAMAGVGYDAATPGNHDYHYGLPQLLRNARAAAFPLVSVNPVYEDTGEPVFPPSIERNVQGVRVGILGGGWGGGGVLDGRKVVTLKLEELGKRLRTLAQEMRPRVDLIVAVVHDSPAACRQLAALAPDVQLFVSGHSHEALPEPLRAAPGGALIVQAGCFARNVGELEVTVDLDTKEVAAHKGRLVEVRHRKIKPDEALARRIRGWNARYCPRADRVVGHVPVPLAKPEVADWLAEAIRDRAGARVGLVSEILLSGLPAGPLTEDGIFHALWGYGWMVSGRMAGQQAVCLADVSGARILAFLERELAAVPDRKHHLAGATLVVDERKLEGQRIVESDIVPDQVYRLAAPRGSVAAPVASSILDAEVRDAGYTVTEAAAAYARHARTITAPARRARTAETMR
ncbi:MAG: metallophosphoesterase [Armatimonadetes bacterium]|nr:metallophosphoesterase [Armatimonadota bacterium]